MRRHEQQPGVSESAGGEKNTGVYDSMLNACPYKGKNSVVARLIEVERGRAAVFLTLYARLFSFFPGIGAVCDFLDAVECSTHCAVKDLAARSRTEIQRSVEAIIGNDEQTLNDSARVLMEIEVLLREWRLDLDRMDSWAAEKPSTIHRTYGFGKVLNRVKQAEGVPENYVMPEWHEYEIHSARLHPTPEVVESLLPGPVLRVSELVSHVSRVIASMVSVLEVDDPRLPQNFLGSLAVDMAPWSQLRDDIIGYRDSWIKERLAKRGLMMAPRMPIPKGVSWSEGRVVPLESDAPAGE